MSATAKKIHIDRKIKTDNLIIGAGPAGLACAMELSKAHKDFVIIEKQSSVGGLSKTYTFEEDGLVFRTDNGPHRFFSKNDYLYTFIQDLLQEQWIKVNRQTRQYIDGKFYDYPINVRQSLNNIGFVKSIRILFDYSIAKITYGVFRKKIKNFEDYVHAHFGKALGEFNIINYTEKIWGIPANAIHTDWAVQRIKGLSIRAIIKESIFNIVNLKAKNKHASTIDTFYYPQFGTGLIYETIAEKIRSKGYEIILNAEPKTITIEHSRLKSALILTPTETIEIEFNNIIESIPITTFVKLLSPKPSTQVIEASRRLKHRSQIYLFITIDKEYVTKDQWIYFPDTSVPIARVSEMKNFSKDMSPKDKTSLFIEFFCTEGDDLWNSSNEKIFHIALEYFEKIHFFTKNDIRKYYVFRQKDVYPIYNIDYKKNLEKIKKYLDAFPNLYYIGRPGRFRYNNQDHSLEMGIKAARSIIHTIPYDIESVGNEQEYFEKVSSI